MVSSDRKNSSSAFKKQAQLKSNNHAILCIRLLLLTLRQLWQIDCQFFRQQWISGHKKYSNIEHRFRIITDEMAFSGASDQGARFVALGSATTRWPRLSAGRGRSIALPIHHDWLARSGRTCCAVCLRSDLTTHARNLAQIDVRRCRSSRHGHEQPADAKSAFDREMKLVLCGGTFDSRQDLIRRPPDSNARAQRDPAVVARRDV